MALYRKYRPQKFMDLVGQEHVRRTLTNALLQGKVGHAYLFSGPRGTGKTTVARLLAKALNCQKRAISDKRLAISDSEPCDECQSCIEIKKDQSLDVIEIDAASNRGIDEIRELRDKIKYAPSGGHYKVYIIDEIHMLTREAFNALLKTLEEPPKHAVFVMATTELHKVPDTILSRTQQFDFKRASIKDIVNNLDKIIKSEQFKIDPQAVDLIARSGEGSFRDATSILDQVSSISSEKITLSEVQEILGIVEDKIVGDLLELISDKKSQKAIDLINKVYSDGYDLVEFGNRIVEYLRKILLFESQELKIENQLPEGEIIRTKKLSGGFSVKQVLDAINLFIEAIKETKTAAIAQLPLELTVMEIISNFKFQISDLGSNNVRLKNKENVASSKNQVVSEDTQENKKIMKQKNRSGIQDNELNPQSKITRLDSEVDPRRIYQQSEIDDKSEILVSREAKGINHKSPIENLQSEIPSVDSITLKSKWPEIIEALRPENHSLSLLVSESEPLKIEGGKLILGVKYKFYAERIREPKKYEILTSVLEKVLGQKLAVECVVSGQTEHPGGGLTGDSRGVKEVDSISPEDVASDDLLADAMEVFGT